LPASVVLARCAGGRAAAAQHAPVSGSAGSLRVDNPPCLIRTGAPVRQPAGRVRSADRSVPHKRRWLHGAADQRGVSITGMGVARRPALAAAAGVPSCLGLVSS